MGDRALIIFKNEHTVSPTAYLHWAGCAVPGYIAQLSHLMAQRRNDVSYAAARFIGIVHAHDPGPLSLGVFETPDEVRRAVLDDDADVIDDYSHGDAGVVIVDTADFSYKAYGGYLADA